MRFILEEFDQKKYEKVIREDGYEDGYASGTKDGYANGYLNASKEKERKVKEMIQTMFGLGMAIDQIAQIADMSAEEVEQMIEVQICFWRIRKTDYFYYWVT